MILISACLAGENCKYNGGNNLVPSLKKLVDAGEAVTACPEQLGGLSTPRPCAEILAGRVLNTLDMDVTAAYEKGAEEAYSILKKHGCTCAVLKSKSPSCGSAYIYDGTFSHTIIAGDGVFARYLKERGIKVLTEEEWEKERR